MSSDNATGENLIYQLWATTCLKCKEGFQLFCLIAILSTYLFALLKPNKSQNNKALGSH